MSRGRGQYYMCTNGHLVKDKMLAGKDCGRCRYNEKRRGKRAEARNIKFLNFMASVPRA